MANTSHAEDDNQERSYGMLAGVISSHGDIHGEALTPGDTRCGVWCFSPSCLQPLANMKVFIPAVSLTIISSMGSQVYTNSQVTTLERQFGISSTQTGLMLGANDVTFMLTILLWSHFTKNVHKPRLLAFVTAMFGIAGLLTIVPHLLMISEAGEMYETTETSSPAEFDRKSLCLARNSTKLEGGSHQSLASGSVRRIAFIIMFIAFGLQGVVKAPRAPTTQTYIDDNVPKTQTGIYLGVMACFVLVGPMCGSLIGGAVSKVYVTLKETSLTPRDPRWIGAWWLGFLGFALFAFVAAIPMLLFPRRMPKVPPKDQPEPKMPDQFTFIENIENEIEVQEKKDTYSAIADKPTVHTMNMTVGFVKEFGMSLLRLINNPLYVMIVISDALLVLTLAGSLTFIPKYLEQYFRVPMGRSNILFAITSLLPASIGAGSGGFLISRLKLTIRGCLVLRWVTDGMSGVMLLLALLVKCDQPEIHGVSHPPDWLKVVVPEFTNMTCDTECMCLNQDFLPSCGADGRNYFSPCHAGCMDVLDNGDFSDCACMPESATFNKTLTPGYCEGECGSVVFYLALSFGISLMSSMNAIPVRLTRLRSVENGDRSLSVGVAALLNSMIGYLMGPIIFGQVVDSTCINWSTRGSCSLYNSEDLRIKMHLFTGGVMVGIVVLHGLTVLITYKMKRYHKIVEWQGEGYNKKRKATVANRMETKQ